MQNAVRIVALVVLTVAPSSRLPAETGESDFDALANAYKARVRPLLSQYCHKCHCEKRAEAEVNLDAMESLADVRRSARIWQKVAEMLASDQMPPKESRQPTDDDKKVLREWVRSYLLTEARAKAGDPGPVVLRRLNNAEYTYTIRDLTGVNSLEPAREFPTDGAAGEGFTNTGNALVMSPSLLTKYFDRAKQISSHAVLLPDGLRFSPHTTRRDRTEEVLQQIRDFYARFVDAGGGDRVNLQGIIFDTNQGGRLPLQAYLEATLAERDALEAGRTTTDKVATERGLNGKYLSLLWNALALPDASSERHQPAAGDVDKRSLLLDDLRGRWRSAKPGEAATLAADIGRWQQALWKFNSVGHIGKANGPKAWLESVDPITTRHDVRLKLPAPAEGSDRANSEIRLYLSASDVGDGNEHDFLVWERPRLVAPGRPDLALRDVRAVAHDLSLRRQRILAQVASCLAAVSEASTQPGQIDVQALARQYGVHADSLSAWLVFLGIDSDGPVKIEAHLTGKLEKIAGYDFITGWGSHETPQVIANSTDQHVRVPGNMKPHGVAVHPSPNLAVAIGWRSPVAATVSAAGSVQHAHPECGNGVTWSLEVRRGSSRQRLTSGIAHGSKEVKVGPIANLSVRQGDLVSLVIGPRDGNHACDLTDVDLTLTDDSRREWNLPRDVTPDMLAGNPHADGFGNDEVWHFYTEPDRGQAGWALPTGSILARWQSTSDADERRQLADQLHELLAGKPPPDKEHPDAILRRQLTSLGGPLISAPRPEKDPKPPEPVADPSLPAWGLDPASFGQHPSGQAIDDHNLCVQAPSIIEIRLPADLLEGGEFVTTGRLDAEANTDGSVQIQVLTTKPDQRAGLRPGEVTASAGSGPWTSNSRQVLHSTPVIVRGGSAAQSRIKAAFDSFRQLFPAALCYTKIVPVDEVVTLTLMYREDDQLRRLMLDDTQADELDRMWDQLHYISHDALTLVDAFEQLWQYATQDADPKVFEPLRQPIHDRAAAFRKLLVDTEPRHLDALLEFASRAYRRPLTNAEVTELRGLYEQLCQQDIPHEDAIRLVLARVLVAPAFLYRVEKPGPGTAQTPISDWELASRLSYFLWSSLPDSELLDAAQSGRLHEPEVLVAHTRRMLRHGRVRRLATEFGCQWLHIYEFDTMNEKSERHFPTFAELRGAMYEESIQFITDLIQRDRSILEILDSDYAILNDAMAAHYGIADVAGSEWRRVDGVQRFSRGGILAHAATLAKQSGASRTSPILRGNWISEVLLGEKLPRPPKDVPQLPETPPTGLTERQLIEKHSADPACAKCHSRIDPLGFALESFDAIGRSRVTDDSNLEIDASTTLLDGTSLKGLEGLREYLVNARRGDFVRQFCRKVLGYALGRSVLLSDELLLREMQAELEKNDYRFGVVAETIVLSRQFREIRGRDVTDDE